MTVRALVGLAGFNILLAVLGSAILGALRPGTTRKELLRLAGVSYLLGVAALMVALTLLLVLGIPVNLLSTVLVALLWPNLDDRETIFIEITILIVLLLDLVLALALGPPLAAGVVSLLGHTPPFHGFG